MQNVVIFETVGELLDGFAKNRASNDKSPNIPSTVSIEVDGMQHVSLIGAGSDKFQVSEAIDWDDLVNEMALRCGVTNKIEHK